MTATCSLISCLLVAFTVWGEKKSPVMRTKIRRLNHALVIMGGILLAISVIVFAVIYFTFTATDRAWLLTLLTGFSVTVGAMFLVVFVSLLLSQFLGARARTGFLRGVRVYLSLSASVACLLLTAFWIASSARGVALTFAYFAGGLSFALLLRLPILSLYSD